MTKLQQMTLRLPKEVFAALVDQATAEGLEVADYAQTAILRHVTNGQGHRNVFDQLLAEADLKSNVADIARRLSPPEAFDQHITLKVFREIREKIPDLYLTAIGGGTGFERGNPQKAKVNRAIGSTVKAALGASSADREGRVTKVEVSGEFCFSYTLLWLGN